MRSLANLRSRKKEESRIVDRENSRLYAGMSKHPAVFDSHPPEVYGSVTDSQRGGLPAQKETIAESPSSTYMPLHSDGCESPNEYDIIPGEEQKTEELGHSNIAHGGQRENRGHVGGGLGSSFRGGEKKMMENTMYEDHDLKTELVHPSLGRQERQKSRVWSIHRRYLETMWFVYVSFNIH